jgi:hypothetical protein
MSPLAFSQQLISEKSPVPIPGGATMRKFRYPSPASTSQISSSVECDS